MVSVNISRRGFLRAAVGGVAVAAAAQTWPYRVFSFSKEVRIATIHDEVILEYADYVNFSSFALEEAMNESVSAVAAKLAYAFGHRIDCLTEMCATSTRCGLLPKAAPALTSSLAIQ